MLQIGSIMFVSFSKALEEAKIAMIVNQKSNNNKDFKALKLTTETDDKDTIRVFQILFDLNRKNGDIFDPLSMFGQDES